LVGVAAQGISRVQCFCSSDLPSTHFSA